MRRALRCDGRTLHYALRQDDEFDVAQNRYTPPGHRRSPERSMISNAAGNRWKMGMSGGEKVQRDVWREDFLRQRGGEEGGEMFLEDPEGWRHR